MTSRHHLSEELRWRAIGRLEAGQSRTEVARWLNVSPSVVHRLWQQFLTTDYYYFYPGGSAKDGQPLRRAPMTDICRYAHKGIEPQLRLNSDTPLLQPPESWCQHQPCLEGFTKVACTPGNQTFACR
ncbi:hypothetical protein AVEN_155113-1 [Araneus ventricosus]|uniref:Transposase IS30-like HTH domain-containing protein n=1 Tax=Araneus ventricosus TaxID=182803 RepID=A0A4Y2A8X2_ARAVE|nr:hypothetical protein AVEN_155113-1 [Araneus ventricosus]